MTLLFCLTVLKQSYEDDDEDNVDLVKMIVDDNHHWLQTKFIAAIMLVANLILFRIKLQSNLSTTTIFK